MSEQSERGALQNRRCVACDENTPSLSDAECSELREQIPAWTIDQRKLKRRYNFSNFAKALRWTNCVGWIAEEHNHHPDFGLGWGWVELTLFTHSINGLSESDFVLAAKIEAAWMLSPGGVSAGGAPVGE